MTVFFIIKAAQMTMPIIPPFIEAVETIIEANLLNPNFGTQELADALFLSRVHLFRKLKDLTGMAPTTFIRHYRLEKGDLLLYNTNFPIKEIAYKIGFKDPAHYTNAYRDLYGIPPSKARK